MINQEIKPVKTWGGFNLAILKVESKSTRKNRNSYNKTYKPPRSTSYCYPPVKLTNTTTCKLRIHGLLLSWILHQIKAHRLCFPFASMAATGMIIKVQKNLLLENPKFM